MEIIWQNIRKTQNNTGTDEEKEKFRIFAT